MFCKKCGKELSNGAQFCPECGYRIGSSLIDGGRGMFASPKFLTMCILFSVSSFCNMVSSGLHLLNLLNIFIAISLWVIYSNAVSKEVPLNYVGYKMLSIALTIHYILNWVVAGIVAIVGTVFALLFAFALDTLKFLFGMLLDLAAEVGDEFAELVDAILRGIDEIAKLGPMFSVALLIAFGIAVAAIIIANLQFVKYFKDTADTVADCAHNGKLENSMEFINTSVSTRLLVVGTVGGVCSLSSFVDGLSGLTVGSVLGFLSMGTSAVAYIMASQMIKRK